MYQAVGSPGSRLIRVTWMLEELGQPYSILKVKQHTDEMRRYNPSGKAPALIDGDVVVTDSAAICAYLAEKHPEKGMAPQTPAEAAVAGGETEASAPKFVAYRLDDDIDPRLQRRFAAARQAILDGEYADAERALSARLDAATSIDAPEDDGGDDDAPFTASTLLEALEVLAARKSVLVSRARRATAAVARGGGVVGGA